MYAQKYTQTGLWYLIDEKYNLAIGIYMNREKLEEDITRKKFKNVKILEDAA